LNYSLVAKKSQEDDSGARIKKRFITYQQRVVQRDNILSEIDRGAELKVLDIDDFLIQGLLGIGTSSEVYLLIRKNDKRKFAGKFLKGEVGRKEFIRETTLINSCSNQCANIINMIGITAIPRCLIMDYYMNGSLDVALRKDRENVQLGLDTEFPFLRRLGYILDMCTAVTELHRRNICHRDIAMRNLILSDDKKHILLTDFSLSRRVKSALKRQGTLSNIFPIESCPETFSKLNSSDSERAIYESWYSLKSDIWSMGITMFRIIDKGFSEVKDWQQLPTRFPKESKPPLNVFDRIDDLWILILRCWNENPDKRPQSFDLEDKIKQLIDNPLNATIENEGYITYASPYLAFDGLSLYEDTMMSNSEFRYPNLSSYRRSTFTSLLEGQDEDSSCNSTEISWEPRIKINTPGQGTRSKIMQKLNMLKGATYEHGPNQPTAPVRPIINSTTDNSSNHTLQNNPHYKTSFSKCIPNASTSNKHLRINRGWKFARRLRSFSSILSTSVSSFDELPNVTECVKYCPSIEISSRSSATNIAYCGDRHFFQNASKLISHDQVDSCEYYLPDVEPIEETCDSDHDKRYTDL